MTEGRLVKSYEEYSSNLAQEIDRILVRHTQWLEGKLKTFVEAISEDSEPGRARKSIVAGILWDGIVKCRYDTSDFLETYYKRAQQLEIDIEKVDGIYGH